MNGTTKFHKATGPAFNAGEVWHAADGTSGSVTISKVTPYVAVPTDTSDYEVSYISVAGGVEKTYCKDAWNFQVRYYHQADADLCVTNRKTNG